MSSSAPPFTGCARAPPCGSYQQCGKRRLVCRRHGGDTALWMRRWRWFFLATAGLFGYAGGSEWGVSHYRLRAAG
jgi:hypothetical protein